MLKFCEFIFNKIDILLKWMIVALLGGMSTSIFLQVITRYIFEAPLAWSEELARFMFIWLTFIGCAMAARKGNHIAMDMVQNLFKQKIRKAVVFLTSILTSAFFGVVAFYSVSVFNKMMSQTSPALNLPIGFVYLGLIIGSLLTCAWYAVSAFKELKEVREDIQ